MNENIESVLQIEEWAGGHSDFRSTSSDPRLCLTVIATTTEGTTVALNAAAALSEGLDAKTALLKVDIVPSRFPLGSPPVPLDITMDRQRVLLQGSSANIEDATIRICLCRDFDQCLLHVLRRRAVVLIGGRRRWWTTAEEKLESALVRLGHHVIFIDAAREARWNERRNSLTPCNPAVAGPMWEHDADVNSFLGREEWR
jgi:hypothetical protein